MAIHIGSRGLPEFGVTEWLGDLIGASRTPQGGSDIFPNRPSPQLTYQQPTYPQSTFYPQFTSYPQSTYQQPTYRQPTYQQPQPSQQPEPSQPSQPSYEDIINQQYGQISSELDRIIDWLPQQQQEIEGRIGDIVRSQTGEIERAREAELARFPGYRQQVETRQARTLEDLASNLRNVLQAGNIFLGTRGAAESSAAPMLSFALAQEANKQRANVRSQADQMLAELDLKEQDVRNAANEQINAVNTWKSTQLANIANQFAASRESLMREKANVRARAVEAWLSYLSNIDQQARAWEAMITNWGQERLAQLNNYKLQLSQIAAFNPQDIIREELRFNPLTTGGGTNLSLFNPYLRKRPKEEERLLGF